MTECWKVTFQEKFKLNQNFGVKLDTESRDDVDENGGGRNQYKYTNSVENRLASYAQDKNNSELKSK